MANLDAFYGGLQAGNDMAETQRAQRNRALVGNLAGAAIGGDPQAMAKVAAVDPRAASSLELTGQGLLKRTRGAAQYLQKALQGGNPMEIAMARQQIKPYMDTLKPGTAYSLDMDPAQELAGIQGFLSQTQYLDPTLSKGTPTDVQSFQMMTSGLSPEERERARRINLGLEGRASSSGFSQVKFTGADGRERIGVLNGKTGQIDLPDGTSFNPQTGAISATGQGAPQAGLYNTPNGQVSVGEGLTPEQWELVQADVAANGGSDRYRLPDRQVQSIGGGGANAFVGRAPEEQAAAIEAAKQQAQLAYLPQELGLRTQADIAKAQGVEQAKSAVETEAKRRSLQVENNRSFDLYEAAMQGVTEGLGGTTTGPLMGRLPAVTADQQKAEGAVSAIAPILKQLFRSAGEGTFTDKDQELLLAMIPTRTDHAEARNWKIANIDRIIREKLGQPADGVQQAGAPMPAPRTQQRMAPRVGAVEGGYRYKGGNPADPNSWERM